MADDDPFAKYANQSPTDDPFAKYSGQRSTPENWGDQAIMDTLRGVNQGLTEPGTAP